MSKRARRILVAMMGGTVLALGITLLVVPRPAFLVIPAGLAILAVEFAWARRRLRKAPEFIRPGNRSNGGQIGVNARLGALGRLKRGAGFIGNGLVFAVAVALLLLAGAALVVIPAVLGILSLESGRVRGWLRNASQQLRSANRSPP